MTEKILITIPIGLFMILFSAAIPFVSIFSADVEDIIYFRGILLGSLLLGLGGAWLTQGYVFINCMVKSITSGIFSLLFISTYNLIADNLIPTKMYFSLTFIIVFFSVLIQVGLWLWNQYQSSV
jgi:hypothetical protein